MMIGGYRSNLSAPRNPSTDSSLVTDGGNMTRRKTYEETITSLATEIVSTAFRNKKTIPSVQTDVSIEVTRQLQLMAGI